MPDARLEVTDALGRRIVPIAKRPVRDRPPRDQRSAPGRQRSLARSRRDRPRRTTASSLRDRNSRYGTYVNGEQVTERALAHGDRIRLGRTGGAEMVFLLADSAAADRPGDDDGDRRPAPDRRAARRPARARLRPRPRRRAVAGARFGDRGQRRRARLHHAGARERRPRVQDGARPRPHHAARRQLRHQPQDPRGSLPHRRAAHRRRPARRRSGQRPHGHRRARHPQRPVRAAAPGALRRQGRERSARSGASACCISTAARRGRCCRARRAPRSRRWRPRPRSRSRTPGSIARRWRRRGWSRRCGSRRRSSRRCCRRPARSGAYFRAAAASLPCRSIGGDFYDYVDLTDGSLGFALGDVAGKGPPAALLSAMMQGIFAAQAATSDAPSQTITPREPGALSPRHRVALRDADVRRRSSRTAAASTATPATIRRSSSAPTASAGSSAADRSSGCSRARPTRRRRSRCRRATG